MTATPSEQQLRNAVLEALIKGGLLLLLVYVCYLIFSPFLALMLWALVMAITLHPSHQKLSRRLGNRQGLASTLMVLLGVLLLLVPSALLVGSMADTLKDLATGSWQVPAPSAKVAEWPLVGDKLYGFWQQAANDLPSLLQQKAPELGSILKTLLSTAASMGGSLLSFLLSFVIAGIMLAFSAPGAAAMGRIADRLLDPVRGPGFIQLSSRTIQAVAMGILGVAVIQALLIGLLMMLAGVPLAGLLALLVLILGIAQIPASLVTLPVILWLWMGGEHGTLSAVIFTALLLVGGMVDNVLKPMMLGRGVEAPMPVVLLGALGGMVNGGILGMFLGATLLAMGYQLFMNARACNSQPARHQGAVMTQAHNGNRSKGARADRLAGWRCGLLAAGIIFGQPALAGDCFLFAGEDGTPISREGDCQQRLTPASTFKIALALMGFDSGLLQDEQHPALPYQPQYDGWLAAWRETTTPLRWQTYSVVWYSQQLTQGLGQARLQHYLDAFEYGNRDFSGHPGQDDGLTQAWLSSSLAISPLEQAGFLGRMLTGRLPVSPKSVQLTGKLLKVAEIQGWQIHGKTGMGYAKHADGTLDKGQQIGWFVGWASKGEHKRIFVKTRLQPPGETFASLLAKADALAALPPLLSP